MDLLCALDTSRNVSGFYMDCIFSVLNAIVPLRTDPTAHLKHLEDTSNQIFLSSMSIAELLIKKSIGKLDFSFDILELAENMGIEILNFTGFDAIQLESLPLHHKDPFDRMIIAQAQSNRFSIISYEKNLAFMIVN